MLNLLSVLASATVLLAFRAYCAASQGTRGLASHRVRRRLHRSQRRISGRDRGLPLADARPCEARGRRLGRTRETLDLRGRECATCRFANAGCAAPCS